MVMQSAEVRDFDDPAAVGCLLRPGRRCILIQREVGSPLVIVGEVLLERGGAARARSTR